jgi:hypothetical protein
MNICGNRPKQRLLQQNVGSKGSENVKHRMVHTRENSPHMEGKTLTMLLKWPFPHRDKKFKKF